MVEHVVLFQFSETTTKAQKDEVIRRLQNLKNEIGGIIRYEIGYNWSTRNQGYEVAISSSFESPEALASYGPHPQHQAVVAFMREVRVSNTLVMDFESFCG